MLISKVGGLIAAASKTASQPTMLLGGITVVKRIVLTFQQMGLFPIVVVTGVEADEVKYQLAGRGVVFLHNPAFENPELFDSVKIGLTFLKDKCERVAFSPVNIPLFLPATLRALLAVKHKIVTPFYRDKGGHPVLLANSVIPDLLSWSGCDGLRGAIGALSHLRAQVDVADEGVLLNIHQQQQLQDHYEKNKAAFLHPYLRLSLEREEELFNARNKLLLLLIGEAHSMRSAADMMALSPSKAWNMLNQLEAVLGYRLVVRQRGGLQGSRSTLTPEGATFLQNWQLYEESVRSCSDAAFERFHAATDALRCL